ncbi:LysR family transcriptional regulator [Idiomarina sp. OT37-5b]|jgi:LysR family hydrogen peroxide-inducible transcriptional activator|uniref:LysR family transcriptional regulator n=1 Tax=Idiomarina aquatica TaxID=1327752 RepID=A0AA94JEW5_9GAMM|nr:MULTISPECIES: hydrogen peroxide-inducible genes activator [Idiomarina]AVJ57191.1 LysR family transcriptional regulator [Idiomarina sp. OT37-5b]RUO45705.1 LysR family transcriptional regulator [Idiomarina aquatica]
MGKLPSLKNLSYLLALHQQQNFNRAAAACNVSQSTLSSGIQNLEEQLGCQLIERDHKSFLFTAIGEEIVEQARNIITSTEELVHYAKGHGNILEGPVRLGIIPTIAPFVVGALSKRVQQNYPKLSLQLAEDTTNNLLNALRDGDLDILLLALPMDIQGNQKWTLGRDPFKLVAHKSIADKLGEPVDYDMLPDGSIFLLEKEHCLTGHAVSACQLTDTVKVNPFTATSLHSLVQMADARGGATFMSQMAIDHGILDNTDLIPLKPSGQEASRDIGLVYRATTSRRQTFRKIAEEIATLLPINTLS